MQTQRNLIQTQEIKIPSKSSSMKYLTKKMHPENFTAEFLMHIDLHFWLSRTIAICSYQLKMRLESSKDNG